MKVILSESQIQKLDYNRWKRENVTYRGMKELGEENGAGGVLGAGLYSTPLSNKSMAKTYGKVHMLINGKPKKPKVFNTFNEWQIWYYDVLVKPYGGNREFNKATTIESAVQKLGYDGIVIKGREMVNYTPNDVMYFENERQLQQYYENNNI